MPNVILATAGYDHTIRFWEAPSGLCYRTIQHPDSQVNRLEITPDKAYLAAAGNPHIRLFEINTANASPVTSYDGHTNNVTALGFDPEGKWMYSGSEDGTIKIWDLRAQGSQREYHCTAAVNSVCLHPNQAELLSGDQNGNVRVWDLAANACSRELVPDGEVAIRSVSVAPDGSLVAAANNRGHVFIWRLGEEDTSRFDPLQRLDAHRAYILRCLFSPDSRLLATCSADHTVKLWRLDVPAAAAASATKSSRTQPVPLQQQQQQQQQLQQQPQQREFRSEKTLSGHARWVWDAVFSADSAYLVTASSDNSARLWDLNAGETIRTYTGHHKAVTAIALSD